MGKKKEYQHFRASHFFHDHLDIAIDRATRTPVAGVPPPLTLLVPGLRETLPKKGGMKKKEESSQYR
jgi:hypothetical protein